MARPPIRRRITPSIPFTMRVENADKSSFELDLRLSFDFNALALVEQKTGINMLTMEVFDSPSVTTMSALLWAAIQENHPEYEGDEGLSTVRSWLTLANTAEVFKALTDAFLATLPKEKADAVRENMKKAEEGNAPLAESATPA
jgi:hypothetical protein